MRQRYYRSCQVSCPPSPLELKKNILDEFVRFEFEGSKNCFFYRRYREHSQLSWISGQFCAIHSNPNIDTKCVRKLSVLHSHFYGFLKHTAPKTTIYIGHDPLRQETCYIFRRPVQNILIFPCKWSKFSIIWERAGPDSRRKWCLLSAGFKNLSLKSTFSWKIH